MAEVRKKVTKDQYNTESIKTGKWLDISYKNKQNETTYYWIAIKDINLAKKVLIVTIYNDYKSFECLDAFIKVDNITEAYYHHDLEYPLNILQ